MSTQRPAPTGATPDATGPSGGGPAAPPGSGPAGPDAPSGSGPTAPDTPPAPRSRGAAPRRILLRRDREHGQLGGVCAGLAREIGIDPLIVRVAFIAAALAGGIGIAIYILAWVFLPAGQAPPEGAFAKRFRGGRAAIEVAVGTGLLLLAVLLLFRSAGLWFSDAVVWPLVLITSGGALIWRQSLGGHERRQAVAEQAAPPPTLQPAAQDVSRTGLGVALVIAAGFVFLQSTGTLGAARDILVAAIVVTVVLGVILAPWVVRLVRSLGAERSERIRTQERAEMAAHLHDSVLQTLALMQKQADDPRAIATLARRQERELRAWLSGRTGSTSRERRLGPALEQAAEEVEAAHGIPVEVIAVGESETMLDESGEALVAAAREAMMNAAKHGGSGPVNVYAEAGPETLKVFVGDRGTGFDIDSIPGDRRGVRESIIGRMERHGGRAEIRSSVGLGTEVELTLDRSPEAAR